MDFLLWAAFETQPLLIEREKMWHLEEVDGVCGRVRVNL